MKDKDMLDRIHRRATKLIPGLIYVLYDERLKEHGLTTQATRRLLGGGGSNRSVYSIERL